MMFGGKYSKAIRSCCVLLLAITSLLGVVSCKRLSTTEEKIVGLWEFTGLDATGRCVFRRDHIVISLFPESAGAKNRWVPTSWGTWRLEGDEIVTDEEVLAIPGHLEAHRQVTRMPIRAFEQDRLVRADGRADLHRVQWGVEQYAQLWALLCLASSLTVFWASVYGLQKSSLRKALVLFNVAAVLALMWATSTLVAELVQSGTVIISPVTLYSLIVPTEILRVVFVLMFTVAFVKLMFALGSGTTANKMNSDA